MYTDDCLVISENSEKVLRHEIEEYFQKKKNCQLVHLKFMKIREVQFDTGVECWAFNSSQYVQETSRNFKKNLEEQNE